MPRAWAYNSDNGRSYFPEENNGRAVIQRRRVIGGQNGRHVRGPLLDDRDRGWRRRVLWPRLMGLTSSRPLLSGTTAGPGGHRNAIKFGRGIASRRPRAENRHGPWLEQPPLAGAHAQKSSRDIILDVGRERSIGLSHSVTARACIVLASTERRQD